MTPKQRVLAVLRGERADMTPLTIYESLFAPCAVERELRNRGMCIVNRMSVYKTHRPNVKVIERSYWENGRRFTRTLFETPVGTLSTLGESAGFTTWIHEPMFKTPDDYKALLFFIRDEVYEPDYAPFAEAEEEYGEDGVFRAQIDLEPLQDLISSNKLRTAEFAVQWMENRDEVLKLYEANVENRRKVYRLVAESPAFFANYGGNVVPEIIGLDTFRECYVPHYNEAAEIMRRHGKLLGCHFDANCRLLAEDIAATGLDYIEAFTPAPDTDMTLGEARAAWPDKVLWLNFPSSLHLQSDAEVERRTREMLAEPASPDGVLMGITENIPTHRWRQSLTAIMNGLERYRGEHPEQYAARTE